MQEMCKRILRRTPSFIVDSFKLVFTNLGLIFFAFIIGYLYNENKSLKAEVELQAQVLGHTQRTAMRADQLSSYAYQEIQSLNKRLEMIKFGQTVEVKILDLNK